MSNLKPAPLSIQATIAIVSGSSRSTKHITQVPISSIQLVDGPRRSGSDIEIQTFAAAPGEAPVGPAIASPSVAVQPQVRPVETNPLDWPDAPLPYEESASIDRLDIIRQAAKRIRDRAEAKPAPRLSVGAVLPRPAATIPPLPTALRRARTEQAIAFLKAQGTLATPIDPAAQIRRYLITGRRLSVMAEDVIALAEARGMPAPGGDR